MALPPLEERAASVLRKEVNNLKDTYKQCAEMFGPQPSDAAKKALKNIETAINLISAELTNRSAP